MSYRVGEWSLLYIAGLLPSVNFRVVTNGIAIAIAPKCALYGVIKLNENDFKDIVTALFSIKLSFYSKNKCFWLISF